jgi:hypothetical protein
VPDLFVQTDIRFTILMVASPVQAAALMSCWPSAEAQAISD